MVKRKAEVQPEGDTPRRLSIEEYVKDIEFRARLLLSRNFRTRLLDHIPSDGRPLYEHPGILNRLDESGERHLVSAGWWKGPGPSDSELAILHVLPPSDDDYGMPVDAIESHLKDRNHELDDRQIWRLLARPFLGAHTKRDKSKRKLRNPAGDAYIVDHEFPKTRRNRAR